MKSNSQPKIHNIYEEVSEESYVIKDSDPAVDDFNALWRCHPRAFLLFFLILMAPITISLFAIYDIFILKKQIEERDNKLSVAMVQIESTKAQKDKVEAQLLPFAAIASHLFPEQDSDQQLASLLGKLGDTTPSMPSSSSSRSSSASSYLAAKYKMTASHTADSSSNASSDSSPSSSLFVSAAPPPNSRYNSSSDSAAAQSTQREISSSAMQTLVDSLKNISPFSIQIITIEGDKESFTLGKQVKDMFEQAGWTVGNISEASFGDAPKNITLVSQRNTVYKVYDALQPLFTDLGCKSELELNEGLPADTLTIIVGAK